MGRKPWTDEQREQYNKTIAKRRKEKERLANRKRDGNTAPWSEEMRASNKATWERKAKETEEARLATYEANPGLSREVLGIPKGWESPDDKERKNARYLRKARVSMDLPPIDLRDIQQIEDRTKMYLDFCEREDAVPQLIGWANWLGVTKETLDAWKRGDTRKTTHAPFIQRIIMMLEEVWVDRMQENKINPANGIFLAKNLFQYRDQQDVVVQANSQNEKQLSATEIEKYYLDDGKAIETTFVEDDSK